MPLSEYEQRVLDEMEQQLSSDDPRLVRTIASGAPRRPLHVAIGGIVLLVGVALLFAGLYVSQIWLGLIGFLAMFGGVLLALHRPSAPGSGSSGDNVRPLRPTGGHPRGKGRGNRSSGTAFMQRLEERWERRRREQ